MLPVVPVLHLDSHKLLLKAVQPRDGGFSPGPRLSCSPTSTHECAQVVSGLGCAQGQLCAGELPAAAAGQKWGLEGQERGTTHWGRTWHLPCSRKAAHFMTLSAKGTSISF